VLERLAPIDEQHRNVVAVLLLELHGDIDINLLESEWDFRGDLIQNGFHCLAEAAILSGVKLQFSFH
jgi:hypothetical protein